MASIGDVTRPAFAYDQATDTWVPVGIGPHSHTAAGVGAVATSSFAAKGDLLVGTGAGTLVAQTVGANGTVLTADSAEADGVKWAAPAAGAYISIASGSLSGTSLSLTSISASYKDLRLVLRNVSTNNNADVRLRLNNDTGLNYYSAGVAIQTGAALAGSASDDNITLTRGPSFPPFAAASTDSVFIVDLLDYTSASFKTGALESLFTTPVPNTNLFSAGLGWISTAAINRIDVYLNSTHQFDGGTYILYGVN